MVEPCVVIISGLPGSGKSTTARALARRMGRAAHVEADVIHTMITSGMVLPDGLRKPQPGGEAQKQLQLRLRQACVMAKTFVEEGFTAVVDDIVINERLDEALAHLAGVPTRFVMLSPEFMALRDRWTAMGSPFADKWDWIEEERLKTDPIGLWIDTTTMTVDEVCDTILQRFEEAAVTT